MLQVPANWSQITLKIKWGRTRIRQHI